MPDEQSPGWLGILYQQAEYAGFAMTWQKVRSLSSDHVKTVGLQPRRDDVRGKAVCKHVPGAGYADPLTSAAGWCAPGQVCKATGGACSGETGV